MMSNAETHQDQANGPSRFVLGVAGALALLSASCCVLPIGLSIVGLGGAWLTLLGPFVAYRIEILVVVGLVLAWGWFRLTKRWNCSRRKRSTLSVLGFSTLVFLFAASSPYWEGEAARAMFTLWKATRS